MFRLWVVASALFVTGVAVASYSDIRNEFPNKWDRYREDLPALCNLARGSSRTKIGDYWYGDYTIKEDGFCWYTMEGFRRLYPEYKDVSDEVLKKALYAKVGQPLQYRDPWHKVLTTAAFAFGVPLAFLALGWSLFWAFAGFRSSRLQETPNGRVQ
jgi:hypothetical protein